MPNLEDLAILGCASLSPTAMYEKMRAIGALSSLRCAARAAKIPPPIVSNSFQIEKLAIENASQLNCSFSLRRRFCSALVSGSIHGNPSQMQLNYQNVMHLEMPSMVGIRVAFSSEDGMVKIDSSDAGTTDEVYEKMLKCVSEMRIAPPNAGCGHLLLNVVPRKISRFYSIFWRDFEDLDSPILGYPTILIVHFAGMLLRLVCV